MGDSGNFLRGTVFDCYPGKRDGHRCGIEKESDIQGSDDDRSSGCGNLVKKELECVIKTPFPNSLKSLLQCKSDMTAKDPPICHFI